MSDKAPTFNEALRAAIAEKVKTFTLPKPPQSAMSIWIRSVIGAPMPKAEKPTDDK